MGIFHLRENPFLFSGEMMGAHQEIFASVDKKTKVLVLEDTWMRAFANIDIDKVYSPVYMPPFDDLSGETQNFLNGLDVIIVNDSWSTKRSNIGAQIYLRYYLHVEPFLKEALKSGWTMKSVKNYGIIYKKEIVK